MRRASWILLLLLASPLGALQLSAVGDLVIDYGYMEEILAKVRKQSGDEAALKYPFVRVRSQLKGIVFGNLEAPLTQRGIKAFADKNERFYFRSPTRTAQGLALAGFKVLSLANNHVKDCGVAGMLDSRDAVRAAGMQAVGVGEDLARARQPVLVQAGNTAVAFLAYVLVIPKSVWATPLSPGAATSDLAGMLADVKAAKAKASAVVVSLHWGVEVGHDLPVRKPSRAQVRMAHALIDAGASLVLGSHDHAVGRFEEYKDGLIAYSLGNFVFGGSVRSGHKHSVILQAELDGDRVASYSLLPVRIDAAKVLYQPRPVLGAEGRALAERYLGTGHPKYLSHPLLDDPPSGRSALGLNDIHH